MGSSEPVIRVDHVSKRFNIHKDKSLKERVVNYRRSKAHAEEFWALRDVSFELDEGRTLGLIGANGSGKSTLLKLIGGILTPNEGFVERRGRLAALLELGSGFHPDLTGRENVFLNASILGLTRKQTEQYYDSIVDFSGLEQQFLATQVKFYSSGMYVRLAFSVAVHIEPDVLLVDEVLAVGDEPFQRKCMERIKQFQKDGRTILFVTHGLDVVRQLCDRVIMLEHGRVIVDSNPIVALRAFRERYETEIVAEDDEYGTRRLEITKVQVTDADGNAKEHFQPGEPLAVEVSVNANKTTDDWAFGVAIYNHLDVMVHGTNTTLQKVRLPPVSGRQRVRLTFDEIPMLEGQYSVTVALHNQADTEQYHRMERTASFRVFDVGGEVGILHMNSHFDLLDQ